MIAGIKEIDGAPVGDTITLEAQPGAASRWPGFKQVQPRVFAGLFPVSSDDYEQFRDALEEAQAQRLGAAFRARGLAPRWASDSAADSSACCTWTSCRSGSSANTTWI